MSFDYRHYVPCLRWKLGEYQAVLQLSASDRELITPLIEIPEIGYDFETATPKKSCDEHLSPQAKRINNKWGDGLCFVDLNHIGAEQRMINGTHPVTYIFSGLREAECSAIPVTSLDRDEQYQQAVKRVVQQDGQGICLRISLEQAAKTTIGQDIEALLKKLEVQIRECDLILDYGAPNFEPIAGFSKVIKHIIRKLPNLIEWRTFSILGTSFPYSMAEVKGRAELLPRYEWILYKKLVSSLNDAGVRLPTFGDYAISHPNMPNLDWRLVKPAATIRYTANDAWYIIKGPNVRDNKFTQYRDHCRSVIVSTHYCGTTFSKGDQYIADCAKGTASTGNLTTWRKVGTNHHLAKVLKDIANLFSP